MSTRLASCPRCGRMVTVMSTRGEQDRIIPHECRPGMFGSVGELLVSVCSAMALAIGLYVVVVAAIIGFGR